MQQAGPTQAAAPPTHLDVLLALLALLRLPLLLLLRLEPQPLGVGGFELLQRRPGRGSLRRAAAAAAAWLL
jgi:hypothetical protein